MSRPRSFKRGPNAYRRAPPRFAPSGKAILIVTEGEKTEPNYLKSLRDRFQLSATDIVIVHPEGTDPVTLVTKALELREERKREAREGLVVEYDEVWVVFDLERPHDERRRLAAQALAHPEAKGLKFAHSDPCFEYWLLLHGEFTTASFADCAAVAKRLEKHWKGYAKGQTPAPEFLDKVPVAVTHAERCREYHRAAKTVANPPGTTGNPSTAVDLLVRSMNEATRLHLQFQLSERVALISGQPEMHRPIVKRHDKA
jgi:hypothetical protein